MRDEVSPELRPVEPGESALTLGVQEDLPAECSLTDCRDCGAPLSPERAEAGYDYCTDPHCVAVCLRGPDIIAVHVNKASDQYVRREDVDLQAVPRSPASRVDPDYPRVSPRPPAPKVPLETLSDAGRIAKLERELDERLAQVGEDDRAERVRLINEFNGKLRAFNIRYRTLARREP